MQVVLVAIKREFDKDIKELLQCINLTTEEGEERRRARVVSSLKKLGGSSLDDRASGDDTVPGVVAALARSGKGGTGSPSSVAEVELIWNGLSIPPVTRMMCSGSLSPSGGMLCTRCLRCASWPRPNGAS